nr:TetR/AcrR family transcriptional regulator C-terminal domain-containing protein [Micromonospora sp. DSM 115978]
MFAEREWREAIEIWARSYRAALAAHPNIVPFLVSSGLGRRPAALRMADEVFGSLVAAGWPRGWATRIGAMLRYMVTGSSMGSLARGFIDDARVYVDHYPHLDEAHLLKKHQSEVDDGAFELGLRILLDGLAAVHADVVTGSRNPLY